MKHHPSMKQQITAKIIRTPIETIAGMKYLSCSIEEVEKLVARGARCNDHSS
jgi:hypothetical protein